MLTRPKPKEDRMKAEITNFKAKVTVFNVKAKTQTLVSIGQSQGITSLFFVLSVYAFS